MFVEVSIVEIFQHSSHDTRPMFYYNKQYLEICTHLSPVLICYTESQKFDIKMEYLDFQESNAQLNHDIIIETL